MYSPHKLDDELDQNRNILNNGYPTKIVNRAMNNTLIPYPPASGPQLCAVYLKRPWIGSGKSESFEKQINQKIKPAYPMCQVKVCFTTKPVFKSSLKDGIPTHQRANIIYHFMCRYSSWYVGKTTQRLEARIGQHIPSYLNQHGKAKDRIPASAIGEHLAYNGECLDKFDHS